MTELTFKTPEELFQWHVAHANTDEEEDRAEVGDTRCPWCQCRIRKLYHEKGCPVRDLLAPFLLTGISFRQHEYPNDIDAELVPLLDAMNSLPGIETRSSCCGHGGAPVRIWFRARDPKGLFFLTRCVDHRYWKYGYQWSIALSVGDMMEGDGRPIDYVLQSVSTDYGVLGEDAYVQVRSLVDNMLEHLKIPRFMEEYSLNIADFAVCRKVHRGTRTT